MEKLCRKIEELRKAFKSRNIRKMKDLVNRLTKDLLVFQDKIYLHVAVLSQVLAKTMQKPRYWVYEDWKGFLEFTDQELERCIEACERRRKKEVTRRCKGILQRVKGIDKKDARYINDVIEHAKVKIGATLYAHGMSLGTAAFLSDAPRKEIQAYAGRTLIPDRFGKTLSISERLKHVRRLFRRK